MTALGAIDLMFRGFAEEGRLLPVTVRDVPPDIE